ncbi:MAG: HNH endonuclease [Anaerolineae bacterium]|nr:HNH endonuclease [Anaerolineae bacterium]
MPKRCTRCYEWKDDTEFYKDKSKRDGLRSHCKSCHEAYKREYRARPVARALKRRRTYLRKHGVYRRPSVHNSPEFYAWLAKKRAQRRERAREHHRRWYSRNRSAGETWRKSNTETIRANRQQQRAEAASVPINTLSSAEWQWLLEKYEFRCAYCGCRGEGLTPDHVIPLSRGGDNALSNIVPSCSACNLRKGARTPEEAGMSFAVKINAMGDFEQLALV